MHQLLEQLYALKRELGSPQRIEQTQELLAKLGNPEQKLKFIHVAGTNGKGSVCAMLAAILEAAGMRGGLYTSPHLIRFNERIKINTKEIPDEELKPLLEKVLALRTDQTFFETTTALAFRYFAEKGVDMVIAEAGVGGRLDATNLIPGQNCLVTIITPIGIEHTERLGETIEKIAAEKAGAVKEGVPCVTSNDEPAILRVIHQACAAKKTKLFTIDADDIKNAHTNLYGDFEKQNAALAACAIRLLNKKGLTAIDEKIITTGLMSTVWLGRMQFEAINGRDYLFDGAHNPHGCAALATELEKIKQDYNELVLVFGVMNDKDIIGMTSVLFPLFTRIILTKPSYGRSAEGETIYRQYNNANKILPKEQTKVILFSRDVPEALHKAQSIAREKSLIVVSGSLYLVGEALQHLTQTAVLPPIRDTRAMPIV